jgi:hypothetical protein
MTGTTPVSASCISRAAKRVELDGQQRTRCFVMISLTFIPTSPNQNRRNRPTHFTCSDSMYLFKLLTRNCTSELCAWLMRQNSSPQSGISFEP